MQKTEKILITKIEGDRILNARGNEYDTQHNIKIKTEISTDMGKTKTLVTKEENHVEIKGHKLQLKELEKLKESTIYFLEINENQEENRLLAVELFSTETNLYYKLKPTSNWPTLTLSAVPMHRFKHMGPKEDTESKIKEIKPVKGIVLDTCCGLGYTAIMESQEKDCERVDCFERDKNVLAIAKYNPYSNELFTSKKINLKLESIFEAIKKIHNNYYDAVIHDPPTVSFAPELYTTEFYINLHRILKNGARGYHYCPAPGKTKGNTIHDSLIKRLIKVGFKNVEYHESSSGIVFKKA
jgi:predicted methyltransferase